MEDFILKNSRILILILILVLIIFGFLAFQNQSVKKLVIGDEQFSVPSQYQEEYLSNNLVKISSGDNVYFITEKSSSDVKIFVNKYVKHKKLADNQSVNIYYIDNGNFDIYKSVVSENSSVIHYWFVKNGKGYEIYTGTADSNSDDFILDIINS